MMNILQFLVSTKQHYDLLLDIVGKFLSPSEISMLKLGLSLRIYSARVEMFVQMSLNKLSPEINCNNFIDVNGYITCNLEDVDKLISQVSCQNIFNEHL